MRILSITLSLCAALGAQTELPPPAAVRVDFDQHIRPILTQKCISCHGSKVQQSGLRLDKRQNALRGGNYGPVILPGKSAESKLIRRLVSGDGGMQMPPTGALEREQIALLRAWIDQGADFGRLEIKDTTARAEADPMLLSLIDSVRRQDVASVRRMVARHPELVKAHDTAGSTPLHHAAGFGTIETIKLLVAAGADVNAANDHRSTPLHWAVTSEEKVRLLLEHGAAVNAKVSDGRTPLYMAVSLTHHLPVARLLLEKGADPNVASGNQSSPLMAAAARGDVPVMRLLLEHKANVQAVNGAGATALVAASGSGNAEAVRMLIAAGLDVNAGTKRKMTPLASASMAGSDETVKLLLEHGAKVNVQDIRGYSPLMYAAYSEHLPAGVVKTLLDRGADRMFSGEGETARTLAAKRGDTSVARLLDVPEEERRRGGIAEPPPPSMERTIPQAVTQALQLLEKQSHNFIRIGGCNSCHNQNLPSAAASLARERGIAAPERIPMLSPDMREASAERGMDFGFISVNSVGYEMFDLGMNRAAKNAYTDSVVRYLKAMQQPEGGWVTTGSRPPLTSDHIQTTAFAVYSLQQFPPDAELEETQRAVARARQWLEKTEAVTTQERAMKLLGLAWAGAGGTVVEQSAKSLLSTQRADGGWNQLPAMGSDAYATGEALVALRLAGKVAAEHRAYQRGVRYLRTTQAADGSWHVKTRSLPFQPYFDSGFPYEHDQWISAAGTSWASMALALAVERENLSRNGGKSGE